MAWCARSSSGEGSGLRELRLGQGSLLHVPDPRYGSEEQKRHWLPLMARGRDRLLRPTEPDGGSDPGTMKTHATRAEGIGS